MKLAAGIALAMALGGCVQATRHSNAIVFGTNTSLGVNVGTGAASVPAINVGYNRQEAVFLPLLANTRETSDLVHNEQRQFGALQPLLSPCNIDPTNNISTIQHRNNRGEQGSGTGSQTSLTADQILALSQSASANPCLFVAREYNNSNARVSRTDAYSVYASFGGRAGGDQGTAPNASIGVGQYFATGVAAQILAKTGPDVTVVGRQGADGGVAPGSGGGIEKPPADVPATEGGNSPEAAGP